MNGLKKAVCSIILGVNLVGAMLAFAAEPVWLDVRTQQEYSQAHLKDAVLIPYDEIAERIDGVVSDKNAEIQLYCRSGRRAGVALEILKDLGYTNVTNHGGLRDLQEKGYAIHVGNQH